MKIFIERKTSSEPEYYQGALLGRPFFTQDIKRAKSFSTRQAAKLAAKELGSVEVVTKAVPSKNVPA